jgi:hypothetical protein
MVNVAPISHPVVNVNSPGGNVADLIAIPYGAVAWGNLPDGEQFKIVLTSDTAEMPGIDDIMGGILDALVQVGGALKKLFGCIPKTVVKQNFQNGQLVSQTIETECMPS